MSKQISSSLTSIPEGTFSDEELPEIQEQLAGQQKYFEQNLAELHEKNLESENARTRANRNNARYSTGPRTLTGKEISKLNATRHGLTGRTVLLPAEDADAYAQNIELFRSQFQPAGDWERALVQRLADTQWRLDRIPQLVLAIYAMGRIRYVDLFLDAAPAMRPLLLDCYTMEQSSKQLRNLTLQEGRLLRQYASDLKELQAVQAERKGQAEEKAKTVATSEAAASKPRAATATAAPKSPEEWVRFYDGQKRKIELFEAEREKLLRSVIEGENKEI